jgi:hypothetical protein
MRPVLRVCTNFRPGPYTCCADGEAVALLAALRAEVARRGLACAVEPSRCMGYCGEGPNVKAAPGGPLLHHCRTPADVLDHLPPGWPPGDET